ncbi:MAG: hypothetical protein ABI678_07500, partial [Kofleriaceae bacterium]
MNDSLRGAALVDSLLTMIQEQGGGIPGMPVEEPEGLTAEELAGLSLPGGRPLPASLAKLLAFDQDFLDVLEDDDDGKLQLAFRSFKDLMAEEFDEETAANVDFSELLPGPCLVIPSEASGLDARARFMYAGEPDAFGEYPVFVVDIAEVPFVAIEYPGLDVFLADGITEDIVDDGALGCFEHPVYGPML